MFVGVVTPHSLPEKLERKHPPRVMSGAEMLRTYGSRKLLGKISASTSACISYQWKMFYFLFFFFLISLTSISLKVAASCAVWTFWHHHFDMFWKTCYSFEHQLDKETGCLSVRQHKHFNFAHASLCSLLTILTSQADLKVQCLKE